MQMYVFKSKLAFTVNLILMHAPNSLNDNTTSSPSFSIQPPPLVSFNIHLNAILNRNVIDS